MVSDWGILIAQAMEMNTGMDKDKGMGSFGLWGGWTPGVKRMKQCTRGRLT